MKLLTKNRKKRFPQKIGYILYRYSHHRNEIKTHLAKSLKGKSNQFS